MTCPPKAAICRSSVNHLLAILQIQAVNHPLVALVTNLLLAVLIAAHLDHLAVVSHLVVLLVVVLVLIHILQELPYKKMLLPLHVVKKVAMMKLSIAHLVIKKYLEHIKQHRRLANITMLRMQIH